MRKYLAAAFVGAAAVSALAQSIAPEPPKFDVVSIKPSPAQPTRRIEWTPGRFVALGAPFVGLVNMAHARPMKLDGLPDWARTSTWDITATFDPSREVTVEQRPAMIKRLLEDRFQLHLRREPRETPVYILTLARSDGTPGPALQRATLPCDAPGRPRFSARLPPPGERPACGVIGLGDRSALVGGNVTMEALTRSLVTLLGRDVVDRTGLTGEFDFVLLYNPASGPRRPPGLPDLPPEVMDQPDIVTALREQLGLRVESSRDLVDFYVVDRIERPADN